MGPSVMPAGEPIQVDTSVPSEMEVMREVNFPKRYIRQSDLMDFSRMVAELTKLVGSFCERKVISNDQRESVIVSTYKKGGRSSCGNYRGISLHRN